MKKVTALAILVFAMVVAFLSIGQVFGQTSTRTRVTLTPAQIAVRQAQMAQALLEIMPPPPAPPTATMLMRRAQAGALRNSRMTPQPMTPQPMVQSAAQYYTVTDLGTISGSSSYATAINKSGQVVGYSDADFGLYNHAFLYQNNSMQDLGILSGGSFSYAYGINSSGEIVGLADDQDGYRHMVIWTSGQIQDLAILGNSSFNAHAYGINDLGQIVGNTRYINGVFGGGQNFIYSNGSMQFIGPSPGGNGGARAINNGSQVVGKGATSDGNFHAFLWNYGSTLVQDLDPSSGVSTAYAINNGGQIVGQDSFATQDAFLWSNGSIQDLGTLGGLTSAAYGINSSGLIVGYSDVGGGTHAFVYDGDSMKDLNDYVIQASGWTLEQANAINDGGQIVGYGTNPSGLTHAFLLTPIPLGSKEAIEAQPTEKVYGIPPVKKAGKDSLVVITHGFIPQELPPYSLTSPFQTWIDDTSNCISSYFAANGKNDWQVYGYHWEPNAWKLLPDTALYNGTEEGINLGNTLANEGWAHVHLIAHSAGAGLIQAAAEIIKGVSPTTIVQCTFLDPYDGLDFVGQANYGQGVDWSDSYVANGDVENGYKPFTDIPLEYSYNVDVTDLDPNLNKYPLIDVNGVPVCYSFGSTHGWPVSFYTNTVAGNITSAYSGFGFPLSMEGGNWNYATNNYHVGNVSSVTYLGAQPPSCPGLNINTPLKVATMNFSSLESPWQSTTGTLLPNAGGLTLLSGSPAWISFIAPYTNAVNVIDFDADFTSNPGAAGLLSVYWDTNIVGTVNESIVGQGTQHYTFHLPLAMSFTVHVIGFRVDPFTNVQSVVTLTNVVLSQVGVSQPFSMTATVTNGLPTFRLTGQAGFDYSLQASADLVNWSQIAILENTTGTVNFSDPYATNFPSCRFYRTIAPY